MVELLVENVRILKESRARALEAETSTDNNRNLRGNSHGQTTDRYFRPAAKRRARRSAGRPSHDPVHRSPAKPAAHAAVLRRVEGGGFAGWAGLGGRASAALHPQWYPSRRALALSPHHEPRRTLMDHRRSAAGMVPSAGRQAGLPSFA